MDLDRARWVGEALMPTSGAARGGDDPVRGVRVRDLSTGYARGRPALSGISFGVDPGEVVVVVGPNGAGKTTLFRTLLGFLPPWQGDVRVYGHAPARHRAVRGIGFLPDVVAFPPGWTGLALIRESVRLALKGGPEPTRVLDGDGELGERILDTGLTGEELSRPAASLSRGMGRRVALAAIMAGRPTPLLLDEPLTGLDAASRVRLRDQILAAAARGTSVLMASHDLEEVRRVATRVLLLRGGRIERVLERPEIHDAPLEDLVLGIPPSPPHPNDT